MSASTWRPAKGTKLSEKQRVTVDLLCKGYTDKELARLLGVATSTVENTIRYAKLKYGAATRLELCLKHIVLPQVEELEALAVRWNMFSDEHRRDTLRDVANKLRGEM